jgi:hypothetical protein
MADVLFPPWIWASQATWSTVANTSVAKSIFTGASRTLARTGDHFKVGLTINDQSDNQTPARTVLRLLTTRLRGQANRLYYFDRAYLPRGVFPAQELIQHNTFDAGLTGMIGYGAGVLSVADRVLRVTRSNNTSNAGFETNVSVKGSASYILRVFSPAIVNPLGGHNLSMTADLSTGFSAVPTGGVQYYSLTFSLGAGFFNGDIRIYDIPNANTSTGDSFDISWMSLTQCALLNGASQIGTTLDLRALPPSVSGLLLPGDMVQVGAELNMVTASLDSSSSGNGYLQVYRPFRSILSDGEAVVIGNPIGRFIATQNVNSWVDDPASVSQFTLEFEEALDQ